MQRLHEWVIIISGWTCSSSSRRTFAFLETLLTQRTNSSDSVLGCGHDGIAIVCQVVVGVLG